MPRVIVVPYDPQWAAQFERLKARVWPVVADFALVVEHVGSTSVAGLAAKPIIDLDVVIPSAAHLPLAVERLATLGYAHRGDLGIAGRDAFAAPQDEFPRHHLYVCPQGSLGLRNHLALRDYLRSHPEAVAAYARLKLELARQHPEDIGRYVEGKTELILGLLRQMGLDSDRLESIRQQNSS